METKQLRKGKEHIVCNGVIYVHSPVPSRFAINTLLGVGVDRGVGEGEECRWERGRRSKEDQRHLLTMYLLFDFLHRVSEEDGRGWV